MIIQSKEKSKWMIQNGSNNDKPLELFSNISISKCVTCSQFESWYWKKALKYFSNVFKWYVCPCLIHATSAQMLCLFRLNLIGFVEDFLPEMSSILVENRMLPFCNSANSFRTTRCKGQSQSENEGQKGKKVLKF